MSADIARLTRERDEARGDDANLIPESGGSAVGDLVAWVREQKAKCRAEGSVFDTLFRAVSEGGTVWVFDPEGIVRLVAEKERAESSRITAESRAVAAERERDEARERAASLSRELLTAIQARDSYRASAELRVGMRHELEELLGVSDTTAPETFEAGLVRLRALVAAESRAARLLTAMREIEGKTGHFGEAPPPPEWMPMLSLIAWVGRIARRALAAEEGK